MTVQETLDRLGLYWKRDPDFVPVKDAATVRLNVSIGGGGVELLATWPKWYDTGYCAQFTDKFHVNHF